MYNFEKFSEFFESLIQFIIDAANAKTYNN